MKDFKKTMNYKDFLEWMPIDLIEKYNVILKEGKGMAFGVENYTSLRLGDAIRVSETEIVWRIENSKYSITFWKNVNFTHGVIF